MAIVDNLGNWIEIGTISPSFNQWGSFPDTMLDGQTIRFIFNSTDWTKKANTFMWVRHLFYNGNVTQAVRVYPKQYPVIIDLPIPKELHESGNYITDLQTIKIGKFKLGLTPYVDWSVTAQYRVS